MQYKNKRTVLIYLLVFLLTSFVGMFNSEHPLFDNYSGIFYGGIIVVWAMTVLRRIIEPQIKGLLMENAVLLLMLILFHALRYQFTQGQATVHRFMWYCYYIPICFIPVISFKLCLRCGRSENVKINPLWDLTFLPSLILSLLFLTNDRHGLAFSFPDPEGKGYDVFAYGPVYYTATVWVSLLIIATVVITIVRFSSKPVRKDSWVYYVVLGVSVYFLLSDYFDFAPVINNVQFLTTIETFTIFIVCGWEACIQTCLLPSNSGYKYFFENSGLIAKITDKNGNIRIASKGSDPDWSKLKDDYHIMEKEVWGGTLNYAEDISAIATANRELEEVLESLREQNSIQEAENALQEERVHVAVMNRLYDDITEFSSDKTAEIETLLNEAGDDAGFRENLEKACVLASYIKRRGNLYLLGEENHRFDFDDIYLSFKESLDYFSLNGTMTLLTSDVKDDSAPDRESVGKGYNVNGIDGDTGAENIIAQDAGLMAYDCLEAFLESFIGHIKSLMVNVSKKKNVLSFRLMFDGKCSREETENLIGKLKGKFGVAVGNPVFSDGTCTLIAEFDGQIQNVNESIEIRSGEAGNTETGIDAEGKKEKEGFNARALEAGREVVV